MDTYKFDSLKSLEEYKQELMDIHHEIGIGLATDTLIQSDLELLTRMDELVIIIDFLEKGGNNG